MASVETYQELASSLAENVELINARSGASGLQDAFKEGGQLNSVLKLLDEKEKQLNAYESDLMAEFNPGNPGAITRDYVNRETNKNEHERTEIQNIRNRLNELSEAAGQSTSSYARKKATNEFVAGVQEGQRVEKGFLSTLMGVIGNAFKFGGKSQLVESTAALESFRTELATETVARFEIPGKGVAKEKQVEKQVEVQVSSPEVEVSKSLKKPLPKVPNAPEQQEQSAPKKRAPGIMDLADGLREGAAKRRKTTQVEVQSEEVSQTAAKSNIPEAPLMSDSMKKGLPTPPLMSEQQEQSAPKKKAPGIMDLADGLREGAAKRRKATQVEVQSEEVSQTAAKSNIPEAPLMPDSMNKIPPAPPLMPEQQEQSAPKKKGAGIMDLADELRAKAAARSKKTIVSLDHENYQHVSTEAPNQSQESGLLAGLRDSMKLDNGASQSLLDGVSKEQQMNVLYSAMVDGNDDLVTELLSHHSEQDTGRVDEDWGEPILEMGSTFSSEEVTTIRAAVLETQARVERGEELLSKLAEQDKLAEQEAAKQARAEVAQEEAPQRETVVKSATATEVASESPAITEPQSGIPTPPIEQPTATAKKQSVEEVVPEERGSLLDQIQAGKKLKSTKTLGAGSMNVDGFEYTETPKKSGMEAAMAGRREAISGKDEIEEMLEDLPANKQLNELYSAVIEGDKKKIKAIMEVGDLAIFNDQDVKRVCNAATKVAATVSVAKKIIVEKGVKDLVKAAGIELQTGKSAARGA